MVDSVAITIAILIIITLIINLIMINLPKKNTQTSKIFKVKKPFFQELDYLLTK